MDRANRRADTVLLADSIGSPDEELDAKAEEAVEGRRRKVWRKWPDAPHSRKLARKNDTEGELPFDSSVRNWH